MYWFLILTFDGFSKSYLRFEQNYLSYVTLIIPEKQNQ